MIESIPLSSVAPDAQALIRAFRASGAVSYRDVGYIQARENYVENSELGRMPPISLAIVRDHEVPVRDGNILVREYRSDTQRHRSAIVYIHGGGWVIGNLETHDSLCRLLARESGSVVFSIDYRLAPEHPFPIPLEDCRDAFAWLVSDAEELGIDTQRIGIAGDSAGGNLAAVLANSDELRPAECKLRAQALLYPVTDLRCETSSYQQIVSGFPLTADAMHWYITHYIASSSPSVTPEDPRLSPLLAQCISNAPMFILTCGFDPLVDEGIAYAHRAIKEGVRVEHQHLPTHPHGILTSAGRVDSAREMIVRAAAFMRDHL